MWGGGNGEGSVSECFWLAIGWPNRERAPPPRKGGHCLSQVSERAAGVLPTAVLPPPSLLAWPWVRKELGTGHPTTILCLRLPAPLPQGISFAY